RRACLLAAFIWAVNPHGLNMALLWISGRTALCLALFTMLTVASALRRRHVWSVIFLAAALGSQEEAVLPPAVTRSWVWLLQELDDNAATDRRVLALSAAATAIPLVVYAILRSHTTAWTPATAPDFYRFTFQPLEVCRNLLGYLDRAATCGLLVTLLGWIVYRSRPVFEPHDRRLLAACGVWFAASLGVTLFLPVRSSLYAVV